jgi:hypothetical protein
MVAGREGTGHRRSIRDKANLDENSGNNDKGCLNGKGANEDKTTTGRCWVGVKPARESVKGAEEEGAKAE